MAGSKLNKTNWIAALVAGVATLAMVAPAGAQPWRGRDRGGEGVQAASETVERAQRSQSGQSEARAWSRAERAQPQADNGAWQARQAERAARTSAEASPWRSRRAESQPSAPVEARAERPQWQGRNPTYVDPSRQATATNDSAWSRDGERRTDRDRRYRSNTPWNGNRDGVRNWRDSQNHPDASVRQRYRDAYAQNRYRDGYRDGWRSNDRRWSRDWRNDNRYDWYGWRNRNRATFSIGYYYAPYRDYSYRRLSIGYYLDSLFFSSRYWISDPWRYRLPEVYGPYRWVRYYDDILLVDIYSGEVVDVIHDFFY